MTQTTTTRPSKPTAPPPVPDALRRLHGMFDEAEGVLEYVHRHHSLPAGATPDDLSRDLFAAFAALNRWEASDEGRAYQRAVDEYNATVRTWNDWVMAQRQARLNQRHADRIRAAACPRCTATHAGEC